MNAIPGFLTQAWQKLVDFALPPEPEKTADDYILKATGELISDPFAARNTMLECTERFPRNADTWQMLGHCYTQAGDKPNSITAYEKAVEVARLEGKPVGMHEIRLEDARKSGPKGLGSGPA
jgi:predicted Zn-dependent protease